MWLLEIPPYLENNIYRSEATLADHHRHRLNAAPHP